MLFTDSCPKEGVWIEISLKLRLQRNSLDHIIWVNNHRFHVPFSFRKFLHILLLFIYFGISHCFVIYCLDLTEFELFV